MQLCLGEDNGRQGRGDDEDDGQDQPGSQGLHLEEGVLLLCTISDFTVAYHTPPLISLSLPTERV